MEAQGHRLACLLEKLGLESVDVVGSSWGGAVAIFLAAMSRRVRSLVLAAPVNPWSDFGAGRVRFLSGRLGEHCFAWPCRLRGRFISPRSSACTAIPGAFRQGRWRAIPGC